MEKQTLPNATLILVFGILSILGCCCHGVIGLIFGVIAIVLANKAKRLYVAEPEIYSGYNNVKTGKILAIIGIVLSVTYILITIFAYSFYGLEELQEMQREMLEQYGMEVN